jgi:hypothetical protein
MAISKSESANIVRKQDPSVNDIGHPEDLNNYLPDSGATQHMTPRLADLVDMVGSNAQRREKSRIECWMTMEKGL